MTVNGRPRWTCRTLTAKVVEGGRLEIGPLANLPVLKDLACDMAAFFDKWQKAKGVFAPGKSRHDPIEHQNIGRGMTGQMLQHRGAVGEGGDVVVDLQDPACAFSV